MLLIDSANPQRFDAESLIRMALGPPDQQNLSAVLTYIAHAFNAHGCVIWEMAPDPALSIDLAEGQLFVLGSYFRSPGPCAMHDLSVSTSITGRVILGEDYVIENDVPDLPQREGDCAFIGGCKAMISLRLSLQGGSHGALSLYRTEDLPFTEDDAHTLQEVCRLLPILYPAAHDRVGFKLSKAVDRMLLDGEVAARSRMLTLDEKKTVLRGVCQTIADSFCCHEVSLFLFDCREVSLFLQDNWNEPVSYKLIASTIEPLLVRKEYSASEASGLTGWVLKNKKPVWIFDLAKYDRDQAWIQRLYPNLSWADLPNVEKITRQLFALKPEDGLPPLCVAAIPIQIGQKVIGVIRCSIGKGPYYFSRRDQDLLALVAAQIGQCWSGWLSRRELETENKSWTNLIESIKGINTLVQKETEKDEPDESLIYQKFLDAINSVIPPANLTSVRLIDSSTSELYYKMIRGSAWDPKQWDRVKDHRAQIRDENSSSAAVRVINKDLPVLLIPDTKKTPFAQGLFPEIKRKIVVPIKDAQKFIGVLDIRSTGDEAFSKHAQDVAQLLGLQLGIYRRLVDTISRLKKEHRQQSQTWADISHQLKGPIYQAKYRANLLTDRVELLGSDSLYRSCRAVRGLCRKAQRVVESLKLIAKLARDEQIQAVVKTLDHSTLMKMLVAASQDAELMIDPSREIVFKVEREGFSEVSWRQVRVDHDLLEQAINNIFDNAGKYSYANSTVTISGAFEAGYFIICVRNRGLPISKHETSLCVLREWRGAKAIASTQEGSGIGLWIVDHIMKSHGGRLTIEATTPEGMTHVKLMFPLFLSLREGRR